MDMITLNDYHKEIIQEYNNSINRIAYEATQHDKAESFLELRKLLDTVVMYSNEFFKSVKDEGKMEEWMFMYPNMSYYAMAGFLLAKKWEYPEGEIDELNEELILEVTDAIGDLSDILKTIDEELVETVSGVKTKSND